MKAVAIALLLVAGCTDQERATVLPEFDQGVPDLSPAPDLSDPPDLLPEPDGSPVVPHASSLEPASATAGDPKTVLTVHGVNFDAASKVTLAHGATLTP